MYTIYKVKYSELAGSLGLQSYEPFYTFEPNFRYHEIVEEMKVKYKIIFKLSYRGSTEYDVWGLNDPDGFNIIKILSSREEYAGGGWNYTEDEFERQFNGALHMAFTKSYEFIDPELLSIFQMIAPYAIAGRYNLELHGWEQLA